ncbi:hypothetical protein ACO0LF_03610 [Undibacterium sp. Di27W]
MSIYTVTVRTPGQVVSYPAIAPTSADAILNALDHFGVASVSALPLVGGQ